MAQPLICRVNVVTETDRVHIGVKPARRGHNYVPGWNVVGFDKPGVAVAALYLEAVEVGGWERADEMLRGEECGHERTRYEVPFWFCRPAIVVGRPQKVMSSASFGWARMISCPPWAPSLP